MTTKSKVAVIGLGNIGQAVTANLAKSNRTFIAADKNVAKAKELSAKWGATAQPSDITTAVKEADILVLSIPFGEIGGFLKENAAGLEGKIIVDPSNPIAPDENGGFKKIIDADKSAGQINATFLPKNAKLAKALGTLGVASLASAAYQKPDEATLFYATDDKTIDTQIEELITDNGFAPVRVGDLTQSIRLEVFGDLHEFGALGKTVTATEAKSLLMGSTANEQSKDKAAVETLVQNYFDALNSGDATKVTSYFTKTGVLLASGAPTATGSEQVNGTFKYVFDNFSYSLKVTIGEVIVEGNYAIVSSTSTGSFIIKAKNETVPADYRETFVLLKENGVWKIARYMYNQPK